MISAETLIAPIGGAVLLVAFLALQARKRQLLLRLGTFRDPQRLLGAAWVSMWFFLYLYLYLYFQQVLGAGAFASGAALHPITALIVIGLVVLAPRLQANLGARPLIATGLLILCGGLIWLSRSSPDRSYAADFLPTSMVAALGMALHSYKSHPTVTLVTCGSVSTHAAECLPVAGGCCGGVAVEMGAQVCGAS